MVEKNQKERAIRGDEETEGEEEDKKVAEYSNHICFRFVYLDSYDV